MLEIQGTFLPGPRKSISDFDSEFPWLDKIRQIESGPQFLIRFAVDRCITGGKKPHIEGENLERAEGPKIKYYEYGVLCALRAAFLRTNGISVNTEGNCRFFMQKLLVRKVQREIRGKLA